MPTDISQYNVDELINQLSVDLDSYLTDRSIDSPLLVGIHTGGVWVADALNGKRSELWPLGQLNISFYRDDFTRIGLHPNVTASHLPFDIENRHIILVDDIIMSGRTIRAALNELFDYGRPLTVTLVTLINLMANELPIKPDLSALTLTLQANERIKLQRTQQLHLIVTENKSNQC